MTYDEKRKLKKAFEMFVLSSENTAFWTECYEKGGVPKFSKAECEKKRDSFAERMNAARDEIEDILGLELEI